MNSMNDFIKVVDIRLKLYGIEQELDRANEYRWWYDVILYGLMAGIMASIAFVVENDVFYVLTAVFIAFLSSALMYQVNKHESHRKELIDSHSALLREYEFRKNIYEETLCEHEDNHQR